MSDVEEEAAGPSTFFKPSFVLVAIDTHSSMFIKGEKTSSFGHCISACHRIAETLLFEKSQRNWSQFAITLAAEDNDASFVDFSTNILETIKLLKEKNEIDDQKLKDTYERKGPLDLSAFLLSCKKKFKTVSSVFYKRTLIFITNDDNPVLNDKNQHFAVMNEAKNFNASDIDFQLVTLRSDFDFTLFYNELFSVMGIPVVENIVNDEEGLIDKLSSAILRRYFQRKVHFYPFQEDDSRFIILNQKSFIHSETLYCNASTTAEGKTLKKVNLQEGSVEKKYSLSTHGDVVSFNLEENLELKNQDLPVGYTLIHVSNPINPMGLSSGKSQLLDIHQKEELQFFNKFWQYCADNNKVLICVRKLKQPDHVKYVELIPKYANNFKMFLVRGIPFGVELKRPPSKLASSVKEEKPQDKVDVINKIIERLTFKYNPTMFPNPGLSKKKAFLKSKFLDEPQEPIEDVSLNSEAIDDALSDVADKFNALFVPGVEKGTKRKQTATRGRAKKVR